MAKSITNAIQGLAILSRYAESFEIDNVKQSFPLNSAPNHSHQSYIIVEVNAEKEMTEGDQRRLIELGWRRDSDGAAYVLEDF